MVILIGYNYFCFLPIESITNLLYFDYLAALYDMFFQLNDVI